MKPEILLLVPTLPEIEPFLRQQGKGYGPVVTGIGPYRCAAATQVAIMQRRPDMMILCGIAGRYPASALAVGDAVLVGSERAADMGSFEGKGVRSEVFRTVRLSAYSGGCSVAGRRLEQREPERPRLMSIGAPHRSRIWKGPLFSTSVCASKYLSGSSARSRIRSASLSANGIFRWRPTRWPER